MEVELLPDKKRSDEFDFTSILVEARRNGFRSHKSLNDLHITPEEELSRQNYMKEVAIFDRWFDHVDLTRYGFSTKELIKGKKCIFLSANRPEGKVKVIIMSSSSRADFFEVHYFYPKGIPGTKKRDKGYIFNESAQLYEVRHNLEILSAKTTTKTARKSE